MRKYNVFERTSRAVVSERRSITHTNINKYSRGSEAAKDKISRNDSGVVCSCDGTDQKPPRLLCATSGAEGGANKITKYYSRNSSTTPTIPTHLDALFKAP